MSITRAAIVIFAVVVIFGFHFDVEDIAVARVCSQA